MTFKELINEDYSFKSYAYFQSMLAVQNKVPLQVTRIDNSDGTTLFVFLLENNRGLINTKRVRMATPDALFFSTFVADDFPTLDLKYFDRRAKKEEEHNAK